MSRTRPLAATVALVLLLAGCSTIRVEESRSLTVDHVSRTPLRVTTQNGSIDVQTQGRSDVLIEATIRAAGSSRAEAESRLSQVELVATRQADGTLLVEPRFPEPRLSGDATTFVIRLPDASRLDGRTSNGRISADGIAGPVTVGSSNGAVIVRRAGGAVDASTSNGSVTVEGAPGPVTISTSNGGITAVGVGWPIQARTSNGKVKVVTSADATGTMMIATSNGSVSLTGAENARRTDITRGSVSVSFDETGPTSSIRSSNGSISVQIGDATGTVTYPGAP